MTTDSPASAGRPVPGGLPEARDARPSPATTPAPADLPADGSAVTLARSDADGFDIALRARLVDAQVVHELVVNGMFAMDSTDRSSELALADLADPAASRVLVGGLGLGFTAQRVLERCPSAHVDVVDLSASLVGWARRGLTPTLHEVARSGRTHLVVADIAAVLVGVRDRPDLPAGPWDAVLLDVDNGPDFLIHDHNAALYEHSLLGAAMARVAPGGVLAIWSERRSPDLETRLAALGEQDGTMVVPVERDGHHIDYAIHWARRAADASAT